MKLPIYADCASTTRMSEKTIEHMAHIMRTDYGNPSSPHDAGFGARDLIKMARGYIAGFIGADPECIYFTSGATEANNWAIHSTMLCYGELAHRRNCIVTPIEHHSVLRMIDEYLLLDAYLTEINPPVSENGIVDPKDLERLIDDETFLVSVMYANNETGMIQPIREIGEICKEHNVIFHCDATQAVGHVKIDVERDGIDMLTASAHKFGGPKGVGFLYARKGIELDPLILGGEQERNKRAGTENVAGIAAMAYALGEAPMCLSALSTLPIPDERISAMIHKRNYLIDGLLKIPGSHLNGSKENRLPNNVNISFEGVMGEMLCMKLSFEDGIYCSSGSACTTGDGDPSHVLTAMGRSPELAHGALRITFEEGLTMEQADYIIERVTKQVEKLREFSERGEKSKK